MVNEQSKQRRTSTTRAAAVTASSAVSSSSATESSWNFRQKELFFVVNCGIIMAIVHVITNSQLALYIISNPISYINNNNELLKVLIPDTTCNNNNNSKNHIKDNCTCKIPTKDSWTSQGGQDDYLFHRVFFQQGLCCRGTFVEFGARDGIQDSNTYRLEKDVGWSGLLFEVDAREWTDLERNRPGAHILHGPVCPSYMSNVTIALSDIPGWTGSGGSIEPTRKERTRQEVSYKCYHLATELRKHNMTRIDYMTIDTEGSELDIVLDFPWNDFDVRVVQIEQLVEDRYPAQRGKKERIIQHLTSPQNGFGYKLLGVYIVDALDTDDLIFTRDNLDEYLHMTDYMRGTNPKMKNESTS